MSKIDEPAYRWSFIERELLRSNAGCVDSDDGRYGRDGREIMTDYRHWRNRG